MILDHHVIVIPGLGNEIKKHLWATSSWKSYGITPHIFEPKWKIEEPRLAPKLNRAIGLVDSLTKNGKTVSLVGNSAGSSLALNVFGKRKNKIHKVIINCGRVRAGDWPWFTFDQATIKSPSFRESVSRAEKVASDLTSSEKKKILTLRAIFDELVPASTVMINGASNKISPSIEHMLTIGLNMTVYKKTILQFILFNM